MKFTINGIDYEARAAELEAAGVDPHGDDDTQFGTAWVYCNQHVTVHGVGWCTVSNIEKFPLADDEDEARRLAVPIAERLGR